MSFSRSLRLLGIAALFTFHTALGETHISGDIGGRTLAAEGSPYIVDSDIIVPRGKKTVFQEGCVFLFKQFTSLRVIGSLDALGTPDKRVIFTSANDESFDPTSSQPAAPFDWNGIVVESDCQRAAFRNIFVAFSVFGIQSKIPSVVIENGVFSQNGQYHFTINDKVMPVYENIPVNNYVKEDEAMRSSERKQQEKNERAVRVRKGLKTTSVVTSCVVMAGAWGLGGYGLYCATERDQLSQQKLETTDYRLAIRYDRESRAANNTGANSAYGALICVPVSATLFIAGIWKPKPKKVPALSLDLKQEEIGMTLSWRW